MLSFQKLSSLLLLVFVTIFFSACSNVFGPQKAGLQVISAEIAASVFINDQYLDKTPFINKELKPGEYILKIQPDNNDYASYETKISLKKGLLTVVTWKPGMRPEFSGGVVYEMEKSPEKNKSQLSLISIPDRAIVSIDGKQKNFAPFLIEDISPGHHEFEVSLPSYESQKHTINVLEDYRMLVSVKLAKQGYSEKVDPSANASSDTEALEDKQDDEASDSSKVSKTPSKKSNITGPRVLINKTGFFVENQEVLRVRDTAVSGKEIGFAAVGQEYEYLGESKAGWYKINFADEADLSVEQVGWVSGQYSQLIAE